MHKLQECTLELGLPVEMTGADAVLVAIGRGPRRTQPALWACTIGQPCVQLGEVAPAPTAAPSGSLGPAGTSEVVRPAQAIFGGYLVPRTEGSVEITGHFSDLVDRILCRICAHSIFTPGKHSETPSGPWPSVLCPQECLMLARHTAVHMGRHITWLCPLGRVLGQSFQVSVCAGSFPL